MNIILRTVLPAFRFQLRGNPAVESTEVTRNVTTTCHLLLSGWHIHCIFTS
jgi:hypothetical protein